MTENSVPESAIRRDVAITNSQRGVLGHVHESKYDGNECHIVTTEDHCLLAQLTAAEARCHQLEDAYNALTGEKFSDRVHVALKARAEEAEAKLALQEHSTHSWRVAFHNLEAESAALREALQSIANSSCCEGCQEAALVAKAALGVVPPTPVWDEGP